MNPINSKSKLFGQIGKFVIVGFINTGVDFAIFNLLMRLFGVYKDKTIILLNVISFTVAAINSYFWNKFWVFRAREADEPGEVAAEFFQFFAIAGIGAVINSAVVYGITTFIPSLFGIGPQLWANAAKAVATGISLLWSFVGYKFIVFKK